MTERDLNAIWKAMGVALPLREITQLRADEDNSPYQVWKLETDSQAYVLKEIIAAEREIYETFLLDCGYAPKVYGFAKVADKDYLLMEYFCGNTLNQCDRKKLTLALDALIEGQARYWHDTDHADAGYCYDRAYADRRKRLEHTGALSDVYAAYLEEFSALPRTLCNDDLLPFNVLVGEKRAVIWDWEYAGILPYPCALARLLAFGVDDPTALFQMSQEDKQFALDYYYENLIRGKGISRSAYDRSMKLFFFREYTDWLQADTQSENYLRYMPMATALAEELRKANP